MSFAEEQINAATMESLKQQFSELAELDHGTRETLDKLIHTAIIYGKGQGMDEVIELLERGK